MFDIQETTKNADCSFTTKLKDKNVVDIGSDVTLSCCLDKEYRVRWYKDQCEISMNDKFKFKDERWEHKLIIAGIQEEDSGVYSCESGTTKTSCKLNIEDCSCYFTTKLVDGNVADIGSEVTLSCCLDKEYGVRWYKDQREIFLNGKFKIKDERWKHKLIIADIQEKDSGVYSCETGTTKTSCKLKVEECSFTTKLEGRNVVDIGSDVTLSCCLDKEYGVRWYKDQCEIVMNDKFRFKDERLKHKLIIADIQEEDSGVYSCEIGTTKTSCKLKVEDCSFTTKLENINVIGIGSDVMLLCRLDKEYDVQWYKDEEEIILNDKFKVEDGQWVHKFIIAGIQEEDSGVYSCECGTTKTRCVLKVEDCSFTTKLEDRNVIGIGSDVTLSCCLDKEYDVLWYKDQEKLILNDKFKVEDEGLEHKLIIVDIQEKDSGVYCCHCGTTKTRCELKVEVNTSIYRSKIYDIYRGRSRANRFIKQLEDVTITEGENLILICELSAECKNIKWYKTDDATISYGEHATDFKIADSNAHKYQLEINQVKIEQAGEYNCYCHENITTTCNVTVKEIKIDDSLKTTTLLHELSSTKSRLKVKEDEILNTITNLKRSAIYVNKTENSIKESETEIVELRARLKEQENMLKCRESELKNNEKYIKVLEDKNQQLAESVKKLESKYKELESTKQLSAQMQKQIQKLEGEKKDLKVRVSTLESYINDGKINKEQQKVNEQQRKANEQQQKANAQQQKVLEDMRRMMEEQRKSITCSVS